MLIQIIINTIQLSCINQYNENTDFIIGFKYPNSYDFNFMTDMMTELIDSEYQLTDQNNVFSKTLKQIYDETSPVGNRSQIIMYNDATNGQQYGHQKGVLAYDPVTDTGFWVTHSIPNFPIDNFSNQNKTYLSMEDLQYPTSGKTYGQHLLCLSLDYKNIEKVAQALYYDRPPIYYSHISDDFKLTSEYLAKVADGAYDNSASISGVFQLQTRGKMQMKLYYKNKAWQKDIWGELIAQDLRQKVYVNTWERSGSVDTEFVNKICQIEVCIDKCQQPWKTTKEHSKLGVTPNAEYTCFSDINFDSTQINRGGGAVCMRDVNIGQEMLRRTYQLRDGSDC